MTRHGARIRKFQHNDLDQVLALSQKYASWDTTPTEADMENFHSTNPDLFIVAEQDGQILGFVYGVERNLPDEVLRNRGATKAGSIEILAVSEEHRRKGVATSLLDYLFQVLKLKGVDYVSLAVPSKEIAAKKLHDKLGFQTHAFYMSTRL